MFGQPKQFSQTQIVDKFIIFAAARKFICKDKLSPGQRHTM